LKHSLKILNFKLKINLFFAKKINSSGFTLIEMVVVMAMIGIVSMATLKLVRFSDIQKNLTLTTAEVKGVIRTAQTLALAPPIKIDDHDNVLHICGFVVKQDSGVNNELKIDYVLPADEKVETCRGLSDINQICNGTTTTCDNHYETRSFEGFSIKQGAEDVKIFFRAPYGEVLGAGDDTTIVIQQVKADGTTLDGYKKAIKINKQGKINVKRN